MIYKINGEQPFQVLSTSFTVSPSDSGYDLYLSADGFEYSYFITVQNGITKQLVQMNNGNYYKLIGNTSIVSVNWERDCHGGGGGGGTAGVSSLDGQTGALTTKTINGNAILGSGDIVISGGTGGSNNYQIVDDLSEVQNPQAGTKVYVRSGSTTETYNGFTFDGTQISEGYVGTVQRNGNTIWAIYRSGTDFYWGWNNDGNIHSAEQDGETCFYMCDTQNGIFYIFIGDLNGVTAVPSENVTTGSTSTGVTISWEAQSLIYTGAEYVTTSDVVYDLDSMTQSERASLINYLLSSTDIERIGAHIYKDHMKCRFDHIEDGKINFNCHYIDRGNAFPQIKTENFFIRSDGAYEAEDIQNFGVTVNAWVNYNDTGHTLQTSNISLWGIGRSVATCNLNIILTTGSSLGDAVVTAPAIVERTGDWTGNFYVTFIYDGKKIEASWSFDENTPTTTKWVETPL